MGSDVVENNVRQFEHSTGVVQNSAHRNICGSGQCRSAWSNRHWVISTRKFNTCRSRYSLLTHARSALLFCSAVLLAETDFLTGIDSLLWNGARKSINNARENMLKQLRQDAAVTSEPATRASDDCCEVCLINRNFLPCGHDISVSASSARRRCISVGPDVHSAGLTLLWSFVFIYLL